MCPVVLAVLGPTASGKTALALALAERYGGEVINCDSTAVYRGFDIGTDKPPVGARGAIPHHLIDITEPTEGYTAARFALDAAGIIRDVQSRGRVPIVAGGTGLYYRALTRGLFPGPPADEALRARLDRVASRRGPERLHRMLRRVDPQRGGTDHAPGSEAAHAGPRGVFQHRAAAHGAFARTPCRRSQAAK